MRKFNVKNIVVILGLPPKIASAINKKSNSLELNRRLILAPEDRNPVGYTDAYITNAYEKFASTLIALSEKKSGRASLPDFFEGTIVCYLPKNGDEKIGHAFFPDTLVQGISIPTVPERNSPQNTIERFANELVDTIKKTLKQFEKARSVLHKEITSKQNSTPLLLPPKNFGYDKMFEAFSNFDELLEKPDLDTLKGLKKAFLAKHPRKLPPDNNYPVFQSKKGVFFCPPGRDLHGLPDLSTHRPKCWIRSNLRFGARFNPKFHYDCSKDKGRLDSTLTPCCDKQVFSLPKGRGHVNISPNDHLR